jgi:hypothetical protein
MTAMNHAVQQYLPSIRIICTSKIYDFAVAEELIDELLVCIEKNFRYLSQDYEHPISFDYWHLDRSGDIYCYTRNIDLCFIL